MKRFLTNKLILSALCIVIGMAPLVAFVNTSESGRHMFKEVFGNDKMLVSLNLEGSSGVYEDFKKMSEAMPEIGDIIPISKNSAIINSYKSNPAVAIKAVGSSYWKFAGLKILKGKFISKGHLNNNLNVIVIDDITADELFGTTNVIGRKVDTSINGVSFEAIIIGICKRMDVTEIQSNQEQGFAYIPITMLDNNLAEYNMQQIVLSISDHQIEEAKAKITHFLLDRDVIVKSEDFKTINQLELIDVFVAENKILLYAITILWFVAAIFAISNIMLVDIERNKKYYGLLSFYGSKPKNIKELILIKSYFMGLFCSLISIIIGVVASIVVCNILNIPFYFSIHSITLGVIIPIVICLLAAIYPSYRGSSIDVNKTIWQLD
jgi:putative ABC transport system permease protein